MNKSKRIFGLGCLFFMISGIAFAQGTDGFQPIISSHEGDVSIKFGPDGEWDPVQNGTPLTSQTSIKTGPGAYCDIALDKDWKNIVSIGADTEIQLGEFFNSVKLIQGRVFARLKELPAGSEFKVITPVAIAGARGTAWESVYNKTAQFFVQENTIFVQNTLGQELDVTQGNQIMVGEGGALGDIEPNKTDDANRMDAWSNRIQSSIFLNSSDDTSKLFEDILENEFQAEEEAFASTGLSDQPNFLPGGNGAPTIPGQDLTISSISDETTPGSSLPAGDDTQPPGGGAGGGGGGFVGLTPIAVNSDVDIQVRHSGEGGLPLPTVSGREKKAVLPGI
jgi:hypothetical protein